MKQSENMEKLFEALAKAQGEMDFAEKKSTNSYFKSKYADLAAVYEAVREPLSNNGLTVLQTLEVLEGEYYLITILGHASGQWISSQMQLMLANKTMQGIGTAITYARRYALSCIVGIAQDDDDGEAATRGTFSDDKEKEQPAIQHPSHVKTMDVKTVYKAWIKSGRTAVELQEFCKENFNKESSRNLTLHELKVIDSFLAKNVAEKLVAETKKNDDEVQTEKTWEDELT